MIIDDRADQEYLAGIEAGKAGILRDIVFSIPPITDQDALDMVRGIRGFPLLAGYRGSPPADIESLVDLLLRVSRLVEEVPEIRELDFNPVRAFGKDRGAVVLDARIGLKTR